MQQIVMGLIGTQDMALGTSTFTRATSTGGTQTLTQVPIVNGSWTPVATNLTQVGGAATISGHYSVVGNLVFFTISIVPVTNTSSVAGTTSFNEPPGLPAARQSVCYASDVAFASFGTGIIGTANIFPPAWTTDANTVRLSGVYELA